MRTVTVRPICLVIGVGLTAVAHGQSLLFDFNGGPQYTGTPVDQISGGARAHFTASGSGFSIQDTAQVIGMLPTGFTGLGMTPNSVFAADLNITFFNQSDGTSLGLSDIGIMVAPQELACDSSSTMKISAYAGTTLVGSQTAISADQNYTWPVIDLAFSSAQPFDNVVIHFQSGPPTGGDWGPIFVADNLTVTPVPEPGCMLSLGVGLAWLAARRRARVAAE